MFRIFSLCFFLTFLACHRGGPPEGFSFQDAVSFELEGTGQTLKLPPSFFESSKYRLERDIREVLFDSTSIQVLDRFINWIEFDDSDINIFVDTTERMSLLILVDMERIPFDQASGNFAAAKLKQENEQIAALHPEINIEKTLSDFRSHEDLRMMRFVYHFNYPSSPENSWYRSIYFLTNDSRSFVAHEFSLQQTDVSDYLWSLK